ncbi:SIS domain-containing protein [Paenibacillus doosanensis]|uniref:Glutamine--fructose-6-phosphate aminotransferase [isomerizing] n=1 Tax=Paenibacillus konkukensis TaxID=2020716 RepID=A0ABY4RJU7_9BACL|nr:MULTISPECIES: SIS domain-containing protein [Paenibacillus]MCS7459816.1 SIS domain-containing protein [Paenibacillus doosanensis]UQZ81764.1 Glutamine--fructose-6-phosphate aminotransferase [isomerizing] [Paenibacillus konkukensis]
MSLTYSEVIQQYSALRETYNYMLSKREDIVAFVRKQAVSSITFVGCGSSYCLSESAAFSSRLRAGLPASALAGGDLMLNPQRYRALLENTLLIAPSRSGSTSEVVEAVRLIRTEKHVPVVALSCVTDSPLSQKADLSLELPWAFDHSVCQTRTVTNLYVANLLINAFIGGDEKLIADIGTAIEQGEAYMKRVESGIRQAADFAWTNAVVLADGELQGLASEGAIALTEIAKVQAHSFHLLDVRHGPMVTVGADTLVIAALTGDGTEHQSNLMRDIKARGAKIIAFADRAEAVPQQFVDLAVISDNQLDVAAQGIPFIFIPQIVALSSAERQGINPDQPDGLVAWVKL